MSLDAEAITASLELVAERCSDPTALVYARLFAEQPALEALFVMGPDAKGHMLQEAFSAILDWVGPRTYAPGLLASERVNHQDMGVEPEVFASFFSVIVDVVEELAGPDWTPSMGSAWRALLEELGAGPRRDGAEPAIPSTVAVEKEDRPMARIRYFVVDHKQGGDRWAVRKDHEIVGTYAVQSEAEAAAFDMARTDKTAGHGAEVNVQDAHGRFGEERTYGHDPKSTPG